MYNNYPRPQGGNTNYNKGYSPTQQPLQPQINKPPVFDFENISVQLFSGEAEKYAEICSEPINKQGKLDKKLNKATQLRRFYDELVLWAERTDTPEKFKNNLPFIYMIKSKVAYAVGRELVDENYQNMMYGVINGIKENNYKTLKNAKLYLEAFMGFYKGIRGND